MISIKALSHVAAQLCRTILKFSDEKNRLLWGGFWRRKLTSQSGCLINLVQVIFWTWRVDILQIRSIFPFDKKKESCLFDTLETSLVELLKTWRFEQELGYKYSITLRECYLYEVNLLAWPYAYLHINVPWSKMALFGIFLVIFRQVCLNILREDVS